MATNFTKQHIEENQTLLCMTFASDPNYSMRLTRRQLTDEEKAAGSETSYLAEMRKFLFNIGDMVVEHTIWRSPVVKASDDALAFEHAFDLISEYLPDIRTAAFSAA